MSHYRMVFVYAKFSGRMYVILHLVLISSNKEFEIELTHLSKISFATSYKIKKYKWQALNKKKGIKYFDRFVVLYIYELNKKLKWTKINDLLKLLFIVMWINCYLLANSKCWVLWRYWQKGHRTKEEKNRG